MPDRPCQLAAAAVFVVLVAFLAGSAAAVEPVNSTWRDVAIEGYDPVAYFMEREAVEGSKQHAFEWMGATWRFASAEHRDLFAAEPEKYAPQYGGYCAYAVSLGKTAGIDPEAFSLVGGKLYLNYSRKIQDRWEADRANHIENADRNWPGLVDDE